MMKSIVALTWMKLDADERAALCNAANFPGIDLTKVKGYSVFKELIDDGNALHREVKDAINILYETDPGEAAD